VRIHTHPPTPTHPHPPTHAATCVHVASHLLAYSLFIPSSCSTLRRHTDTRRPDCQLLPLLPFFFFFCASALHPRHSPSPSFTHPHTHSSLSYLFFFFFLGGDRKACRVHNEIDGERREEKERERGEGEGGSRQCFTREEHAQLKETTTTKKEVRKQKRKRPA
jgi:hypothetical protein